MRFFQWFFLTILIWGLFPLVSVSAERSEKPNIIFFLTDDQDKDETSVYGGNVLTPNLDRLAKEGMVFHNAYMTSTVCTPSRYTCLTGRYAGSSTSTTYLRECPLGKQGLPAFNVALEDDNHNIGQILADNGYATGYVGKFHVGEEFHDEQEAKAAGLHLTPKNAEYSKELDKKFYENEKQYRKLIQEKGFTWAKNIYWGNLKEPFKGHNPEWTIQAAVEFIEEHKDGPFYLHYCTTLMHGPNGEWHRSLTEKELITGEGIADKPIGSMPARKTVMERITKAGLTEDEAGFLWMDDSLGVLLDKLDELKIAENTIIVFISDHGSVQKGSLFRNKGMEVPCIIRWPKGIPAGSVSDELIQNTDFVPTWFELAAAEVPKNYQVDGVSIAPLFKDPKTPVRDYVYGEMGSARSIKTKDYNYIALRFTQDQADQVKERPKSVKQLLGLSGGVSRGIVNPGSLDYDQLYDLNNDPTEQTNLAENPEMQKQLNQLKRNLTQELKRFPNRPFGEFIPGGNTTSKGEVDQLIKTIRKASKENENEKRKKKTKK